MWLYGCDIDTFLFSVLVLFLFLDWLCIWEGYMEFYFWGVCDNLLEALFGNWCSRAFRGPKLFFFFFG